MTEIAKNPTPAPPPPSLADRLLADPYLGRLSQQAETYLTKIAPKETPQATLEERLLQDPNLPLLAERARKYLESRKVAELAPKPTPEPPTLPIQVLEPTTVIPVVTKPEDIQTIQTKLSALKAKLSKVPVSDTAMWQKLSNQISLLANQEVQMLGKVAKNAALSARWHWEGVKDFVPDISHKRGALAAAGLGTAGALAGAAYPISTRATQAFSATRAAITQPGVLPAYGITEATSPQEVRNILPSTEGNNIRTYGNLLTTKPTFFRPGTNEQINPLAGERQLEVLRPAGQGRFLVQTSTGQLEIPMEQVDVQGDFSWEKEVKPLEWLGFDTVVPKLIDRIPEIGAGVVRIPVEKADKPFFAEHPWVVESIKRAREKKLEILLLFNPTKLLDAEETSKRIDDILSLVNGYDKVLFELGNEPDLWPFWENQDLHTYAQFVDMASKILWQRKPDARIVVAATSQEKAIQPLVNTLKAHGINTSKLIFSLHAYQHENEVKERVKLLKQVIGDEGKFLFDEIGVNTSDQDKAKHVPKMIAEARRNGSLYVIIFQLWNVPFAEGADRGLWGFVDYDGRLEPPAWSLVNYAWEQTHQ